MDGRETSSGISKTVFQTGNNGELLVEMGCSAFTLKNARITVGFTQDAQGHIFIDRCKTWNGGNRKKEIGKAAKQK